MEQRTDLDGEWAGRDGRGAPPDFPDFLDFATPVLINMENRPERLRDSIDDLSVAAGRSIVAGEDVHLIRPARFDHAGGFTNAGFRSNLDAHLRAARWGRDEDVERLLVFEDDLSFAPAWADFGVRLLAELDEFEWDFASLGYLDVWNEAPRQDALALGVGRAGAERVEAGWVRFAGQVNGAHAYLVNRRAIGRWIAHLETVADGTAGDDLQGPMPSDGAINTFAWINSDIVRVLAVPNMVGTRPTRSDITPSLVDRLPVVSDVAEIVRGWRRRRHGSKVSNFK